MDTETPFRVLQSTQQLDVSGLEQESVFFQLGHVWLFCGLWVFFGFFLRSSPQRPCEDLGQSQVPEGFSGTEADIWVCPSHISLPLSCEYFGIYFTLP